MKENNLGKIFKKLSLPVILLVVMVLLSPVFSDMGDWSNLRKIKAPDNYFKKKGDVFIILSTFKPYFHFFDAHRELLSIEDGGWGFSVKLSAFHENKLNWANECRVEWGENEIILHTPDGYSINIPKDYRTE